MAALLIVGALYFWVIGIGAVPERFAWNSGLDQYYGLPGPTVAQGSYAVNGYYDLLARAFVHGKLNLPVEPQPELLALNNPWDSGANGRYRLLDAVLYKQHYYLYHGAVPVLLSFAPWYLLTAHDLPENFATFLFALGGYFFLSLLFIQVVPYVSSRVPLVLLTLCLLVLGLGQSVPFLLHRAKLYEVAIACGFFCSSTGFYFLFRWLTASRARGPWAGLSGLCFGLAVGCRPHLGLAAACAFVLILLFRGPGTPIEFGGLKSQRFRDMLFFCLPVIACCLSIAAYNYARFGNPLEFGTRYQLWAASYQDVRLWLVNVLPGLYYLLLCPPNLVAEFPFFRLALRQPFHMPAGYFLEPTAGVLALCPIVLITILTPFCRKRFAGTRGLLAFLLALLVFTAACVLFLAATGLATQRYEVDFAPFLVFVACVIAVALVASLRNWARVLASVALISVLLYAIGDGLALAIQGPYDQFVQASPRTYVKLARWFSPLQRFRPLENPALHVQASFEFPMPCAPGKEPLITTGEFGSRYLLSSSCLGDGRIRLLSETSYRSPDWQSVDVAYSPGLNLAGLDFTPRDRTMTVSWNGAVVLRHRLRFLVTAPSQIHFGWDPTLGDKTMFPSRIVLSQPPFELKDSR
jgi:hypothetical protein